MAAPDARHHEHRAGGAPHQRVRGAAEHDRPQRPEAARAAHQQVEERRRSRECGRRLAVEHLAGRWDLADRQQAALQLGLGVVAAGRLVLERRMTGAALT